MPSCTARRNLSIVSPSTRAVSPVPVSSLATGASRRIRSSENRRCPPGVVSSGFSRPSRHALMTVCWLTASRQAAARVLMNVVTSPRSGEGAPPRASIASRRNRWWPPGVVLAGFSTPRATARRTVAWLTPRRSAASLELIKVCKTCAGLTQHYDVWVLCFITLGISRATWSICRRKLTHFAYGTHGFQALEFVG